MSIGEEMTRVMVNWVKSLIFHFCHEQALSHKKNQMFSRVGQWSVLKRDIGSQYMVMTSFTCSGLMPRVYLFTLYFSLIQTEMYLKNPRFWSIANRLEVIPGARVSKKCKRWKAIRGKNEKSPALLNWP